MRAAQGRHGVRELDYGGRLLSDEASDYLAEMARDGLAKRTIEETRYSVLKLFRQLGCDPPLRDLIDQTPAEFVRWLRATPIRRNRQGTVPRSITRESIRGFLAAVRDAEPGGGRTPAEQTVGRDWAAVAPLLRRIGLDTTLSRRERISDDLLPVRLPSLDTVAGWWGECLRSARSWRQRRKALRLVRTDALLLLTGMRLGECLAARTADLEGRWLLLRITKTRRPRVIYVSRLALAIAASLRSDGRQRQTLLFEDLAAESSAGETRFAGWAKSQSAWSRAARDLLAPIRRRAALPEKLQQTMRQHCSDWMLAPGRRDVEAECLQLGHGGGLQARHYVDAMRRLPALLESLAGELPTIGDPWPAPREEPLSMPDERRGGIWDELRRLLSRGRRREAV